MKVTRVAYSKNLNSGKFERLKELAKRLGSLRSEVWHRFGSINGIGLTHRQIRDSWLSDGRKFNVPARLWKETLRDTLGDVVMYREACKVGVRKAVAKRTQDNDERKELYTLLKYDNYLKSPYLSRKMRKAYKHGQTSVANRIVLDTGCYKSFMHNGQAWIEVISLEYRKRIAIPLNTNRLPSGTLRLILRDGRIEVHYAVDTELVCNCKPCGDATLGIDKGYTEVYIDSDGDTHGDGLGKLLSKESDALKAKYQKRNKLAALEKKHRESGKVAKANRIKKNNLGQKKANKRRAKHKANVRDKIYKATHSVVDKASKIACEDLTAPMNGKSYGKNQNRRLSGWVKGIISESLVIVAMRRGSTLVHVNPAYTSQMDSRYGILLGDRRGDSFHCFDKVVLQADVNAANNILARIDDKEISLYTPYRKVKSILLERNQTRLGLLNLDSSCSVMLSTESELPAYA